MINRNEVRKNLEEMLENPFWAEYYHKAPSARCQEFIGLEFYYSEYEDDETGAAMDAIEDEMNVSDLRHLFRYCGNNPRKGVLARKIAEKENRKGDE